MSTDTHRLQWFLALTAGFVAVVALLVAVAFATGPGEMKPGTIPPGTPGSQELIGNGTFELDTTGWGSVPPNTLQRSNAHSRSGLAAGLATRNTGTADDDVANVHLVLQPGKSYQLSYWILIPTSFSGTGASMNTEWPGSTAVGQVADLAVRGRWQHVSDRFTLGADADGYLVLRLAGAETGAFVYIDDVSVRPLV